MVKDKTVLVTGGAGFIGSHIIDRCLKEGAKKVICLDDFSGGEENNIAHLQEDARFHLVRGSITDKQLVEDLVSEVDVIFNNAASKLVVSLKNPAIDVQTNVVGNFNILEAVKKQATPPIIIHASTGSVFGSSDEAMKENHEKNPSTVYGISKLAAEYYFLLYAKEYNIPVSIIRYFHVFGPRQRWDGEAGVISIFLGKVLKGENPLVFGEGEQIRCFTYVQDVVQANMLVYEKGERGTVYNCASKTRISIKDLAQKIIDVYNPECAVDFGPVRKGENLRPIPDTQKIEKLGFAERTSFEEGLEKTKMWVEEHLDG